MDPVIVMISFLCGSLSAIIAAMIVTINAGPRTTLVAPDTPPWIEMLAVWGDVRWRKKQRVRIAADGYEVPEPPIIRPDDYVDDYRGRHRRDILEQSPAWRTRWAEWDTQGWPTQATNIRTSGELFDMRPDICDGRPTVPEPRALPMVSWSRRPASVGNEPPLLMLT